ncbi:MAG: TlpA family protein disulfide reductase [Magnetococcales bacterium]|nr:TlpA family protein disulfide reductase [Magnetococcales bacterium]
MKRILTACLLAFLFVTYSFNRSWAEETSILDTQFNTVSGETLKLSDYKGQVVVLNFWATWCPPCIDEIPELIQFQKDYHERGLQVIGVDYMERPDQERLSKFIKKHGINYPVIFGQPGEIQKLARAMGGVFGLPVTKFLDSNGSLITSHVGGITLHQLKSNVKPHLLGR